MPELPEVETARAAIERAGLHRRIVEVDDHDTYVCRPHQPGEIREALLGRKLTETHRQGKSIWCDTSGLDGSDTPGPELALHLGMSGHIIITRPGADIVDGGDWLATGRRRTAARSPKNPVWNRFTLTFEDGGELRLFDPRRLGRVRLDADHEALGPDAERVTLTQFRDRVGRGTAPVKARLLDQSVVAGVGNLLADETLWQARISPQRPSGELAPEELARLRRVLRAATRRALKRGGVHTGDVIAHRRRGGRCPRCGAELQRATVGGRTTFWCPVEQV
ncbi:MAG: DNA-formamidopyrimidine glycosylase family protein [Lapillicoccus sp.]